tara:strand:- start:2432 stop:3292 length:861 start_codon:yes stop_codon:yes gene_type:complete
MVSKVVIPVAGLGTRMLPVTKTIPKEMLPIVNKPIIQYIVEEALEAGFSEIILVTHSSKYSIENHFDESFELESALKKRTERKLLKEVNFISNLKVNIQSVRQGEARGLGHAILCSKKIVGKEPFAIILPDMVISGANKNNNLAKMRSDFLKTKNSSILLGKTTKKYLNNYGIVELDSKKNSDYQVRGIIEKPDPSNAPSNLYAAGRYIFENKIFKYLSNVKADKSGEIQLSDAIDSFAKKEKLLNGFKLEGKIFDCGNKFGFLAANIEFSKKDKDLNKFLNKLLK